MTKPPAPGRRKKRDIREASALPERAGQCAFGGGYVDDGAVVDWFGKSYVCRAPNLVPVDDDE
jgi:hypothetical protein